VSIINIPKDVPILKCGQPSTKTAQISLFSRLLEAPKVHRFQEWERSHEMGSHLVLALWPLGDVNLTGANE